MASIPAPARVPTEAEVQAIAGLGDPVLRNLRITECYYRLSRHFAVRAGPYRSGDLPNLADGRSADLPYCANWCTFAVWASRQAGSTIRGEDMLERLAASARGGSGWFHPVQAFWRALLRAGMFRPETRLGRLVREIHSPFDAFERASEAVARGNLKVFEEIGREFARYLAACPEDAAPDSDVLADFLSGLRAGDPPEGQEYLRRAFVRYQRQQFEPDPVRRAQLILLANLEIGLHEQTRLQEEIREAMEAGPRTAADLGLRALKAFHPPASRWRGILCRPIAAVLQPAAASFSRFVSDLTCRIITDSLMVLTLPGEIVLALGRHLDRPFPEPLRAVAEPELQALLRRFEPAAGAVDDCGARDWSDLPQRMHYIAHLFRAFHEEPALLDPPFDPQQLDSIRAGKLPGGRL